MKKITIVIIISLLLASFGLVYFLNPLQMTGQDIVDLINNAQSGSTIYIPAGTYDITETINIIAKSDITIQGAGKELTSLNIDKRMVILSSADIVFKDFSATAGINNGDVALYCTNSKITVQNIKFYDTWVAVEMGGTCDYSQIKNCDFIHCTDDGIVAFSVNNILIEDCYFEHNLHAIELQVAGSGAGTMQGWQINNCRWYTDNKFDCALHFPNIAGGAFTIALNSCYIQSGLDTRGEIAIRDSEFNGAGLGKPGAEGGLQIGHGTVTIYDSVFYNDYRLWDPDKTTLNCCSGSYVSIGEPTIIPCASSCGNSICDPSETCLSCPQDCGLCLYDITVYTKSNTGAIIPNADVKLIPGGTITSDVNGIAIFSDKNTGESGCT